MCAGRIVNTLDSSLHFTSITLSLNITGPTSRELLARAIHSDFIVRVPQPLHLSTLLRNVYLHILTIPVWRLRTASSEFTQKREIIRNCQV